MKLLIKGYQLSILNLQKVLAQNQDIAEVFPDIFEEEWNLFKPEYSDVD